MDSCNSGSSHESSSGGEEDQFDPRAESISSLFNSSHHQMLINPPPPPPPPPSSHHPPFFDSFSNFLPTSPPPPSSNSFLNLDMAWARSLQPSQPNCTDLGGLIGQSSMAPSISGLQGPNPNNPYMGPTSMSMPLPSISDNGGRPPSANSDMPNVATTRGSKKRSRASRRAPTTVLTTDTSNFRAMVQEFTGSPAPPFSASSSPFGRARFDLFGGGASSSLRSRLSNSPPPPYLLRPFVHKEPLSSSSSIFHAVCSSNAGNSVSTSANATCKNSTTSSIATPTLASAGDDHYQLPSDLGLTKQLIPEHQNLLNMQNPVFNFQSFLQPSGRYPSSADDQGPNGSSNSQLKMGMLEEFSLNHGHVNAHHGTSGSLVNFIASDGVSSRSTDHDHHQSWGDGSSGTGDQNHLIRSSNWNYSNLQGISSSCKMNLQASSTSDFHVEKAAENVSARGEGMVESWICSSD